MSERNIALLTDVIQITCVVAHGKGEDVVKAARGAGAGGALIHSVRGVGARERLGLLGIAIDAGKIAVAHLRLLLTRNSGYLFLLEATNLLGILWWRCCDVGIGNLPVGILVHANIRPREGNAQQTRYQRNSNCQ